MLGVVTTGATPVSIPVELVADGKTEPAYGLVVSLTVTTNDGREEKGLCRVTAMLGENTQLRDPNHRAILTQYGTLEGITGNADVVQATLTPQSVYRNVNGRWVPHGGAFSFVPPTGVPVALATPDELKELALATTRDLFHVGTISGTDTPLPMSLPDFGTRRGASNGGLFGPSGSGKTHLAAKIIAAQLRHKNMGILVNDVQGQFSSNNVARELGIDLRQIAHLMGRPVRQCSIMHDLRLPEDGELFVAMLRSGRGTDFVASTGHLGVTGSGKGDEVAAHLTTWLTRNPGWSEKTPQELINDIVEHVQALTLSGQVYATINVETDQDGNTSVPYDTSKPGNRLWHQLDAINNPEDRPHLDGPGRLKTLLETLTPVLSVFSPTNTQGTDRTPIRDVMRELTGTETPKPLTLISYAGPRGGFLTSETCQAIILKQIMASMEDQAAYAYSKGRSANMCFVMDEAARYCTRNHPTPAVRECTEHIARNMREVRKYGVGYILILQEPATLEDSVWKQLSNGWRVYGAGLVGDDLRALSGTIEREDTELYRSLPTPSVHNPRYPFLATGSLSPLGVTASPLIFDAYTSTEDWCNHNRSWLGDLYQPGDTY